MEPIVEVRGMSKCFTTWYERPSKLKELLVTAMSGKLTWGVKQRAWALRDIDFQIRQGEFVGVLGRNGAGKSTLFKILSGIYEPTGGEVRVRGKVLPLVELGAGFQPELSGYENIILNASILGIGRKEITRLMADIIAFSELGEKIHLPIRHYSSGMYLRLGFAIASHLPGDLLLIDEILAVGDIAFQHKCLERIRLLHGQGRTVILITQDPATVQQYCNRCLILDEQHKVFDGDPCAGVVHYVNLMRDKYGFPAGPAPEPTPAPAPPSPSPRNPAFDGSKAPPRPTVYLGDHVALTRTIYGHKMYVDTRSHVGACFLLDGFWEEWVTRHLHTFVKPGMLAVDVGANMGFYTLLLADLVGPTGQVHAFEPHPVYRDILARNIAVNGFQAWTHIRDKAVGSESGPVSYVGFDGYGTGVVASAGYRVEESAPCPIAGPQKEYRFEKISLDGVFGVDCRPIDFIKIDTDGYERQVFQGMRAQLARGHAMTIFCEFTAGGLASHGTDARELLREFRTAGFRVLEFAPSGDIIDIRDEELVTRGWAELLLVRP